MQVSKDKVVTIDYTLTDPQGQVIDTSKGRGPLTYIQGAGNIIPELERQLEGKSAGEALHTTIPAEHAYGEKDPRMIQSVQRSAFQGISDIRPGMQFQARGPSGETRIVTVVDVDDDTVIIDANHPLAGVPLTFGVNVVAVRDATAEELSHGHPHGAGGIQH